MCVCLIDRVAVLGAALDPVHAIVRQKLTTALVDWHPADGSAQALLTPWAAVWPPAAW